jgi:hypothetical protein
VITKFDPQRYTKGHKGHKGHKGSHGTSKLYRTISIHPILNHTVYSRDNLRPLVIVSSAIMIVVHSTEVSTLYPRVVISSLAEQLENLLFAILYTFFSVWPRNHYILLQRSTTGVCHALLWFPEQRIPLLVLWFPAQTSPLVPCDSGSSQSMSQRLITKYGAIPTQPSTMHNL